MGNFTNAGYIRRTPEEIKESLNNFMIQNNPSYQEYVADVQNNLLDTGIAKMLEVENACADTANSFGPAFADSNGFIWEQQASSLGLKYKDAVKSRVTLKFSGKAGTYIPQNTEVKNNYRTTDSLTLGSTGIGYITAESDDSTVYSAGEINEVITNIADDLKVTNPSATIPSQDAETNEELKLRAQRLLRSPRVGSSDYATYLLTSVDGVTERLVSFKFTNTTTSRGIEAIIGGGETQDIANVLFNCFMNTSNLISNPSDNDTSRTATFSINYFGSEIPIVWTLPKLIEIKLSVTLTFRYVTIYAGTLQEYLLKQFTTLFNTRKVGLPLNKNALNEVIYDAVKSMDVELQYLSQITYEIKDGNNTDLQWDSFGYLEALKKDIYTSLKEFSLTVRYD